MKKRRRRGSISGGARTRPRETPKLEGESVEVRIDRIVPGGAGLAHADGRTVFVSLAAPGDHLRVRIEQTRGHIAFASIIEEIGRASCRERV